MARKQCPSNIPSRTEPDSADWCTRSAGHRGSHWARTGRRWTDEAAQRLRALGPEQTPEELAQENETLREDAEEYGNRIEDLKGQVERLRHELAQEKANQEAYEENQVGDANESAINAAREIAELNKKLGEKDELIHSMRLNGARHHFAFAYDKYVEGAGQRLQFCSVCDKDKAHPAHFAQGSRYLDSREVEKAATDAQERLCRVLVGMGLNHRASLNTAREILRGLPGIGDFQPVPGRLEVDEAPRRCACGLLQDEHSKVKHPFSPAGPRPRG